MGNKSSVSRGKVLLNSIIYSFSGLLQKCLSFFLLPLYTAYLTTEDYGITSVVSSFITTAGYIVAFSLFSAVMRFFVDLKNDENKLRRFYGTVVVFIFLSGIIFAVVLSLFKDVVSKYLFSGIDYFPIIFVCLISLIFNCQCLVFDNILRSQQKAMKSSICSIINFLLHVSLNIVFVVFLRLGALGIIIASLICYIIYSLYFIIEMVATKKIEFCLDLKLLKSALKYSIPIMPHNLSTSIAVFVSKLLISGTGSLAYLGVYTVATQFGNMADTVQGYVDSAYGPWLYEKLHDRETDFKKTIRSNVNLLSAIIGLFFVGISLFAQDYIVLFVDKSYVDAWTFVPLIVGVYAIKTAYYFYVEVLFYYKDASKKLFWATLSSSILNVVLSYFFIPLWSVYGSILADAISMALRVIIVIILSKKYENTGLKIFDFVKNFLIVVCTIALGLIFSITTYQTVFSFLNFAYKVGVVCLYVLVMCLLNKEAVSGFFIKIKNKKKINEEGSCQSNE